MKFKNTIEIDDVADFESVCDDILNDFIDSFTFDSPYIREVTENDIEENCIDDTTLSFIFTVKGMNIIDRYKKRLTALGNKIFPNEECEINCSGIIEF